MTLAATVAESELQIGVLGGEVQKFDSQKFDSHTMNFIFAAYGCCEKRVLRRVRNTLTGIIIRCNSSSVGQATAKARLGTSSNRTSPLPAVHANAIIVQILNDGRSEASVVNEVVSCRMGAHFKINRNAE